MCFCLSPRICVCRLACLYFPIKISYFLSVLYSVYPSARLICRFVLLFFVYLSDNFARTFAFLKLSLHINLLCTTYTVSQKQSRKQQINLAMCHSSLKESLKIEACIANNDSASVSNSRSNSSHILPLSNLSETILSLWESQVSKVIREGVKQYHNVHIFRSLSLSLSHITRGGSFTDRWSDPLTNSWLDKSGKYIKIYNSSTVQL